MSTKNFVSIALLSASMLVSTQAMASLAEDRAAVLAGMNQRFSELSVEIATLRATYPSLSGAERQNAVREYNLLMTRQNQLRSFGRIISRYPQDRLKFIVEYFGLPVSLH